MGDDWDVNFSLTANDAKPAENGELHHGTGPRDLDDQANLQKGMVIGFGEGNNGFDNAPATGENGFLEDAAPGPSAQINGERTLH
jgi:hypothetical protein